MTVLICLSLLPILVFASHTHNPLAWNEETQNGQNEGKLSTAELMSQANTNFALKLYKQVSEKSSQQNIFFCPLSISMAFAMLSQGAKSTTQQQILEGLGFNQSQHELDVNEAFKGFLSTFNKPDTDLQIKFGNALFIEEGPKIQNSFQYKLNRYYQADIMRLDFEKSIDAKNQINDYVKFKTNGKIGEFVDDLNVDTVMVLVNYVLFKGEWTQTFNELHTKVDDFSLDEQTKIQVPMMTRTGLFKTYRDQMYHCEMVQLPYEDKAFMLIVVPQLGQMEDAEEALSERTLKNWIESAGRSFVELSVPKFSLSGSVDLKDTLSEMGMEEIFSDKADLSGITEETSLRVSKASHKTVLNVNEYGTEATGATGLEPVPTSTFAEFKVNKPFLLVIYSEETECIVFMGKVLDPTKKE